MEQTLVLNASYEPLGIVPLARALVYLVRERAVIVDAVPGMTVKFAAGGIAIALAFIGKLAGLVNTIPVAVTGGLSIYLFGIIGMQGVALMQSEKVDLFNPKNLAIGSVILILGIGGNLTLANGIYPFNIPVLFPNGIPAIVFSAIVGILMNVIFIIFKKD